MKKPYFLFGVLTKKYIHHSKATDEKASRVTHYLWTFADLSNRNSVIPCVDLYLPALPALPAFSRNSSKEKPPKSVRYIYIIWKLEGEIKEENL